MAEKILKTETVIRTFDDAGKLVREITATVVTVTPEAEPAPQTGQYL
jgi:hypothetical protein